MIRAVCFDLGGVVVRIHRTWEEVTACVGLTRPEPPFWRQPETVLAWQEAHLAHHRGSVDSLQYFVRVAELSRGYLSVGEMERVHAAWLIGEYSGVADLVRQLKRAGYLTACLSNTNDYHWQQMANPVDYPTLSLLDCRLASHELALLKPEPQIYRAALDRLGCRPQEVAFFDDLEENVAAARSAGWNAVQIDPLSSPAEQIRAALSSLGVRLEEAPLVG